MSKRFFSQWYWFFSILLVLFCSMLYVLFPRQIQHAVLVNISSGTSTFYVKNDLKTFRSKNPPLSEAASNHEVFNITYNLLKAYKFDRLEPIEERIMSKDSEYYDLENSGLVPISHSPSYYELNRENSLLPSNSQKLIVGKNNVKSYKDLNGELKTFILSPMDYSSMRVAISTTNFSSVYHKSLDIKTLSSAKLYSLKEDFSTDIKENSLIHIESYENTFKVKYGELEKTFKERLYLSGDQLNITNLSRGNPLFTPTYSGILEITVSDKGLLPINEIDMENYLIKVVPSEMPASSAVEALKCQAVAARTYAISDMLQNRFAFLGFYVDDSTQSQVYNNIQPQARSTEAINATKGLIMTYDGNPIDAKYYSTSAGTGVNYSDIWFNSDGSSEFRPYLSTKNYLIGNIPLPSSEEDWLKFYKNTGLNAVDSSSPYFRWYAEFTENQLTNSLNKSLKSLFKNRRDFISVKKGSRSLDELPELGRLIDIKPLKRSAGGNLIQISFIFENAAVDVSGDSSIRSSIRFSKDYTGDNQISIMRYKSSPMTSSTLPSSFFSVEKQENKFLIYGGGYGHGVGMSQYGAMELGKKGISYESILKTFYNNISIDKIY